MLPGSVIHQKRQGIVPVAEALQVHGTDLLSVPGGVRMMERIVLQRDNHFLIAEMDSLEGQGGVPVPAFVVLLVAGAVVEMEGEVVLALGHLYDAAIGNRDAGVAPANRVVVHLDVVHHSGGLVPVFDAEDVALDTVVEGSGGDFNFALGAADIVPHGINLVDGVGNQAVADKECADAHQHCDYYHRNEHPHKGDAGGLDGGELELLSHLPQGHHGAKQHCQRYGQRQSLAASPHEELKYNLELQAFTYELVYIQPQELKDQYERDNPQDREKRSYEGFQ